MQVELFKKPGSYKDSNTGEERKVINFFLRAGTSLIPIEVKYFASKEDGKDKQFAGRKSVLSAFADELPEKEGK